MPMPERVKQLQASGSNVFTARGRLSCTQKGIILRFVLQINDLDVEGPTQGVLTFKDRWFIYASRKERIPALATHAGNIINLSAASPSLQTRSLWVQSSPLNSNLIFFQLIHSEKLIELRRSFCNVEKNVCVEFCSNKMGYRLPHIYEAPLFLFLFSVTCALGGFISMLFQVVRVPAKHREKFDKEISFQLYSAMWKTEGRHFEKIAEFINVRRVTAGKPDTFPNAAYGFNRRHLIISTNLVSLNTCIYLHRVPTSTTLQHQFLCLSAESQTNLLHFDGACVSFQWDPFVHRTELNGTVSYTGFCIDLLQEMARALNFR